MYVEIGTLRGGVDADGQHDGDPLPPRAELEGGRRRRRDLHDGGRGEPGAPSPCHKYDQGVPPSPTSTFSETAALMRRLLDAVERGELEAETMSARRLLRRIEGATMTLEAIAAPG
jgi:hypothetical protein